MSLLRLLVLLVSISNAGIVFSQFDGGAPVTPGKSGVVQFSGLHLGALNAAFKQIQHEKDYPQHRMPIQDLDFSIVETENSYLVSCWIRPSIGPPIRVIAGGNLVIEVEKESNRILHVIRGR